MSDLIDRQAAIDAIEKLQMPIMRSDRDVDMFQFSAMSNVLAEIQNLPSAQPERKKGKWIRWYEEIESDSCTDYIPHCKCSECGTDINARTSLFIKFCPYCGADMRGEEDGNQS